MKPENEDRLIWAGSVAGSITIGVVIIASLILSIHNRDVRHSESDRLKQLQVEEDKTSKTAIEAQKWANYLAGKELVQEKFNVDQTAFLNEALRQQTKVNLAIRRELREVERKQSLAAERKQ
jgi:uncharacterized membrane protein YvbJ